MSGIAMAQIQVTSDGCVGIGPAAPTCRFQITQGTHNFTFKPKIAELEIGGYDGNSNSAIVFWHTNAGYNELVARQFSRTSDSILKSDVLPINNPFEVLNKIGAYSYCYKEEQAQQGIKEYGVLAQEVERIIPEIVDTVKGIRVVDYDQLIPFLICAVKEQQAQIENLQKELAMLLQNQDFDGILDKNAYTDMSSYQLSVWQNAPNPFNEVTTIQCFIPESIRSVQLRIYDMGGNMVKSIAINERGNVNIQIQASSLSAGIYAYLLTGDGQTSETKQMVLTK
ncbi:MAG: tail fiber domain-containing protein [Bacteroidales bacterium]|nr:tail fiber domain-containing protein [Bacteroidales bacterium]